MQFRGVCCAASMLVKTYYTQLSISHHAALLILFTCLISSYNIGAIRYYVKLCAVLVVSRLGQHKRHSHETAYSHRDARHIIFMAVIIAVPAD